jgi:hypothetical protein
MVDILEGMDIRVFKNSIVLIGAYAPGMQDYFQAASDYRVQMYGVEVHANILESLLHEKIVKDVPGALAVALTAIVLAGYVFIAQRQKKDRSPVEWDHVRSFSNQFGFRIICPGGLPSGPALCNVSAHRRESLQMLELERAKRAKKISGVHFQLM